MHPRASGAAGVAGLDPGVVEQLMMQASPWCPELLPLHLKAPEVKLLFRSLAKVCFYTHVP